MNRQKVNSSNIVSIGYDHNSQVLEIEFIGGGIYQYMNVSEDIYERLMNAGSHGRFLNDNIKEVYQWKQAA